VEGIERYAPEVAKCGSGFLVLRDFVFARQSRRAQKRDEVGGDANQSCGTAPEKPEAAFTVNGICAGDRHCTRRAQFWRIVNASPDLYADLELDSGVRLDRSS